MMLLLLTRPVAADEWIEVAPVARTVDSGGVDQLVINPRYPQGLEAGMELRGTYARAIRLDRAARFVEAARIYAEASSELESLASQTSPNAKCLLGWRAKSEWQREEAEQILEQQSYVEIMPGSTLAQFNLGLAYHGKMLAVRAFRGRVPRRLWDRAAAAYRAALEADSRFAPARLGLAALYAAAGDEVTARDELARIGRRHDDPALGVYVAMAEAALGERDAALRVLAHAEVRPHQRRWMVRSNFFDLLRDAPEFWALVDTELPLDESFVTTCR